MRSLLRGMIAVCGIGRPSGWRNSAVTANQSASPPTIAASAKARTKPQAGCALARARAASEIDAAITTSRPVATHAHAAHAALRRVEAVEPGDAQQVHRRGGDRHALE